MKLWNWDLKQSNPNKWIFELAQLRLILNQCCAETSVRILFQQYRSNSVIAVIYAARLLLHRKRKSIRGLAMSRKCQKAKFHCSRFLFDHLVGAREQRRRHLDAEQLRRLQIDD